MTDDEYDEIRRRIAAARTEHPDTTNDDPEPADESVDEITRRMFHGGDLPDLGARMFRY